MLARMARSFLSFEPYTIWRHHSRTFVKRVNELISTGQFDLVHCDILPICYAIRDRRDVFRSITDHDVSYLKCLSMARKNKNIFLKIFLLLEAMKLKRLERNVFKEVDLGIVVSEQDREVLGNLCSEGNFLVVENGVELDEVHSSGEPQDEKKLMWLGGFDHFPNRQAVLFFLEKVFPLLKREAPDVSLDIIGGGVTKELRRFALNDPRINFTGYVEDPLPYMHRAAVFIAPILSGGGTKLKVLEAMAAGKAVVTTTVGCEGIDGISGRHFIVADDYLDFADNVLLLLNNKKMRNALQKNAREFIKSKYDYTKIAEKLDNYYNACLAK